MKEIGVTHLPYKQAPYRYVSGDAPSGDEATKGVEPNLPEGKQFTTCASHLIRLLYAARQTRPDLTIATTRLTSSMTRWNTLHDKAKSSYVLCAPLRYGRFELLLVQSRY